MKTTMRTVQTTGLTTELSDRPVAEAEPLLLPFDDGADEAVPFVLTAAAHREVLGRQVPQLAAVGAAAPSAVGPVEDGTDREDPVDTRRAQARALLRSGMPHATIAAALGVDDAVVERWTTDLQDELARRRRRAARRSGAGAAGTSLEAVPSERASTAAAAAARGEGPREGSDERLLPGLAFAIAEVEDDTVTFIHDRVEPVAMLLDALRSQGELPVARLRVAVRLAPDLPADRTRSMLAGRLGVDPATIVVGRAGPGVNRGLELRVGLRDRAAAQRIRAWSAGDVTGLRGWDSNPQTFRLTADCSAS